MTLTVGLRENSLGSMLAPFMSAPPMQEMMSAHHLQKLGSVKRALHSDEAELTCPISFALFEDPVIAADGHTYERTAIEEWLKRDPSASPRSPLTRENLSSRLLVPNRTVKKLADAHRERAHASRKRKSFESSIPPPIFDSS